MRPPVLRALTIAVVVSLAGAGHAADAATDNVVAEMVAQGFTDITVRRTFLGRSKIRAKSNDHVRLIVLDPKTGRVFKDKLIPLDALNLGDTPDGTGTSPDGNPD